MPLSIKLPTKEKIIINGAVIENSGESTTIILHNKADIMRRKEVMKEEQATTPGKRIYYACQCAYLFEDKRSEYLEFFHKFLDDYQEAAPSAKEICELVRGLIKQEKYYSALKKTQKIIEHEAERLLSVGVNPDTGLFN